MFHAYKFAVPVAALALSLMMTAPALAEHEHHHHHEVAKDTGFTITQENYPLPAMQLISSTNSAQSLDAILDDEPMMVNFIFTTCNAICPIMAATFMEVQNKANKQHLKVRLVSISIDPEQDTPAELSKYAKKYHAGKDWEFYTGDKNDIINLQRAFNTYRGNKMNHIPITFIRKGKAAQWSRIEGFASANDLINEFKKITAQ